MAKTSLERSDLNIQQIHLLYSIIRKSFVFIYSRSRVHPFYDMASTKTLTKRINFIYNFRGAYLVRIKPSMYITVLHNRQLDIP